MQNLNLIIVVAAVVLIAIIALIRWLYARNTRIRSQLQMNYIFNNITHELLTPLTIISASVEKPRQPSRPGPDGPEHPAQRTTAATDIRDQQTASRRTENPGKPGRCHAIYQGDGTQSRTIDDAQTPEL